MTQKGSATDVGPSASYGRRSKPIHPGLARSVVAPPNNLPDRLTSFIGRSEELAHVRELLGEARLLTMLGVGGCGKTRLALQSAAQGLERFPDGTWWVELAELEDANLLPIAVARALGAPQRPGLAPLEVLSQHLREQRALLVLDNCEHLLDGCAALVDSLLHSCRGLVVLATSREALRVPGELPYRVPSLSLPDASGSAAATMESDAVQLFLDRTVQIRPDFQLDGGNAHVVAAICRGLDGIPLAIELAAARMRMLSPERMTKMLDGRLRLLTQGGRTVAPRHQTLRASIDWSHELCSEQERVLLRRLSVWMGGWTLEGAEAVSGDEVGGPSLTLDLLSGLVDKSLVDTEDHRGEIRYGMLETIRQYATERLSEAGEVESTRARHLAWCLELAESAEPELVRHDASSWLRRLELESANLGAALDWGIAHDAPAAVRLAAGLTFFWFMRGRLQEGATALERVLAVAPEPSAMRGKALGGLAYLNIYRGQFDACLRCAEQALADGESVGDRSVMARALYAPGVVLSLTDHLKGRAPLERSLELAREAGDEWCTADATRLLAASYMRQGEHDLSRPLQEESYALARSLGCRPLYAWYFNMRATGELEHGQVRAARELAEQAVDLANEIGEPVTLGYATAVLIECDVLQGRPADGRARGRIYNEILRSTGAGPPALWLEGALALADLAEGDPAAACARTEAMLPLLGASPAYDTVVRARRPLAVALLILNDLDGADTQAQRLLRHAHSGANEHVEALARSLLAEVALVRGGVAEAAGHLHEALAIAARRGFRLQILNVLESLAYVAAMTGSSVEAARLLASVQAGREHLGIQGRPPEHEVWACLEEDVRTALGPDALAAAWAKGRALSLDEAASYAARTRGKRKRPASGWESLTPTELDVVRHTACGLTNPQIAERMFIARGTVKVHLSHIFAKLGTASRSELAAEATRRGIGPPAPSSE